jgi:hypothetical protein
VLHRLFAGGSNRAAERWRADYLIPGAEALELHHLTEPWRSLGAPRCPKDWIEEELFERRRDLFTEVDLVFSIPLRSILKAAAERPSVNVATVRITGPIFIR